jgi:hypothetical protein
MLPLRALQESQGYGDNNEVEARKRNPASQFVLPTPWIQNKPVFIPAQLTQQLPLAKVLSQVITV